MTTNNIINSGSSLTVDNLLVDGNTISSTDTNGNIILAPDGTGTVSVTASPVVPSGDRADSLGSATNSWDNIYADGITFDDGTNILGTYVPPTDWTPTIVGTTAAGVGTYSIQVGRYARIGNMVIATWNIIWSAHTGTGNMRIGGIPIDPATAITVGTVQYSNTTLPSNPLWGQVIADNAISGELLLEFTNTSGDAISITLDTAATAIGTITYFV